MLAFANLHVLTIRHGEVYVHHVWLLVFLAAFVIWAGMPSSGRRR